LLWTNHRAKGGHVDKVHLQARCMKSMQAVRAKSLSPTSRDLRIPFPCSDDDGDDGDDDGLWLEDEEGSDEEDEYIFALDPDSVAVVQVEGEASQDTQMIFGEHLILPM